MAEPRRFDPLSFAAGLLALLGSGLYLLDTRAGVDVDEQVAAAVLVIAVGAVALVRSAVTLLGRRRAG